MRVHYKSGPYTITYDFGTEQQYILWASDVESIKAHIDSINDDGNAGAARVPKYRGWLDRVTAFKNRFGGEALVPPDIKWAVNDVEKHIGAPVTQWTDPPENHVNAHPEPLPDAAILLMFGPPVPPPAPPAPPLEQPEDAAEEEPVAHKSDNAHNDDNA